MLASVCGYVTIRHAHVTRSIHLHAITLQNCFWWLYYSHQKQFCNVMVTTTVTMVMTTIGALSREWSIRNASPRRTQLLYQRNSPLWATACNSEMWSKMFRRSTLSCTSALQVNSKDLSNCRQRCHDNHPKRALLSLVFSNMTYSKVSAPGKLEQLSTPTLIGGGRPSYSVPHYKTETFTFWHFGLFLQNHVHYGCVLYMKMISNSYCTRW